MRVVCKGGRAQREIFADAVHGQRATDKDVEALVAALAERIAYELLEGMHYDGIDVDDQVFTVTYERHGVPAPDTECDSIEV